MRAGAVPRSWIPKRAPSGSRARLGLPLWALVALAALGVPRAVADGLDLVGAGVNLVLVFAPPVIWLIVVPVTERHARFAACSPSE